ALEQPGDLGRVEPIVLRLALMNRFHVKCVAENEGNVVLGTKVREPVPGEHALDSNDESVAVGRDRIEKGAGLGRELAMQQRLAGVIEDAEVHGSCVQINAAVKSVRLVVETHHGLLA